MYVRRVLGVVALVVLVALAGFAVYAWTNGVRFYAVDSGSMSPTFNTGALVVDEPVGPTTVLAVGDLITFHPTPGHTVTHRIVAIGKDGITTRGDANPSSDIGFVQPGMIAGRLAFSIPYGGYVAIFFQQPMGVVALLIILIGLMVTWELTRAEPSSKQAVTSLGEDAP